MKAFPQLPALAALVMTAFLIRPSAAASPVNPLCAGAAAQPAAAIPWDQIGAKAGADYRGEGMTVTGTAAGARLHCVFQRLDGEATREGLWLTSTVTNQASERFRIIAAAVGRRGARTFLSAAMAERFVAPGIS